MGHPPDTLAPPPTRVKAEPVVVTVCIANWNCRDLLRTCLESLHRQPQGVRFETVVADNASVDGAADMVAAEFPEVKLIRNPTNLGFSIANNKAAAVARGRYVLFLNNDTVVPAYTLRRLVAYAEAHPNIGMVGPRLKEPSGEDQISYRRRPTLSALLHRVSLLRWTGLFRRAYYDYRRDTYTPTGTRQVEALMGAAVFLPRAVFEQVGRWDERFRFGGEDLELSARVNRVRPVMYVGSLEIVHHGRVASRANVGFVGPNVAVGYVRLFRTQGASRPALVVYKLLVTLDAPVQLACKLAQAGLRLARGERAKAGKSLAAAAGLWRFATGELGRFWRA